MSMPRIASAAARASSSSWATLMPPAFPRPPIFTCALMTHGKPISLAAATASSTVRAWRPSGTGMSWRAKSCLPWYSSRSMSGAGLYTPAAARRRPAVKWHNARPMALPSKVNFVTFDVYGTLIDWEKGVFDAFTREASRDGVTIEDPQEIISRFHEYEREIEGGSYELYAEVLRRVAVRIAKD